MATDHRKAHLKEKRRKNKAEKIQQEIDYCDAHMPDWLDDDGQVFTCKACRKVRRNDMKSWTKTGKCILCTGELPSEKPKDNGGEQHEKPEDR